MTDQEALSPEPYEVEAQTAKNEAATEHDDSIPTPDHEDDNSAEDAHAPASTRGEWVRDAEGTVAE